MSGMTIRHRLPLALAIGVATAAVAGCGGSSGGNGSSNRPDDSKELAFAQCLRKAGIDAPDPQIGAGGRIAQEIRVPKGIPPQQMQRITADCARKTGGGPRPMSKADQAKFFDSALKFAHCMRAHGVDIPDPQPNSGGIMIQKGSRGSGPKIDPQSPAFQSAQKACQSLMPGGGKGGGVVTQHSGSKDRGGASLDSVSAP
jgi:hypothetical protein